MDARSLQQAVIPAQGNLQLSRPAHALSVNQVLDELGKSLTQGLTESEASRRLIEYGRNQLDDGSDVQPAKVLIRQIANAMILVHLRPPRPLMESSKADRCIQVLHLAMAVSFGIQSWIEGGVIAAVIVLNVAIGFFQEFQAEKTMDSLRSLSSPTANTIREGRNVTIATAEIAPGDLVEMRTGDTVPADVRLITAVNFETDEALLTGESLPIRKDSEVPLDDEIGVGDRLNIAFSSTTVTRGRAQGIVFATGMSTEIGAIAAALRKQGSKERSIKRKSDGSAGPHRYAQAWSLTASDAIGRFLGVNVGTPLQRRLSKLAVLLFGVAIICAIIVLGANGFSSKQQVIIYAVATGLSMLPASLIVVLTITMAAGTKEMVERHIIVRNLKSLEALGNVTNICSDKTGTLTQGRMIARKAWIPAKGTYSVDKSAEPLNPTVGTISFKSSAPKAKESYDSDREKHALSATELLENNNFLHDFLNVASLANLATVQKHGKDWQVRGDPTEIAIQVFASRFDRNRLTSTSSISPQWQNIAEFPFDSDVKKMSVVYRHIGAREMHIFTKGAFEKVIESCSSINLYKESLVEMSDE